MDGTEKQDYYALWDMGCESQINNYRKSGGLIMDLAGNYEVTLEEMLDARERRVSVQNSLIQTYKTPVVSFTLNIPGPVKVFEKIPEAFEEGCRLIRQTLSESGITVLQERELREKTGYEAFFAADASPLLLKRLMTGLEDATSIGRLYDIDIIKQDGSKVSREETGRESRACLLCGLPAHECSRSRRHSVEELIAHIKNLLRDA